MQSSTLSILTAVPLIVKDIQLRTNNFNNFVQSPTPCNLLLENAVAKVREAEHLQDAGLKTEVEQMLRQLFRDGFIRVEESDANRYRAVAGVQWAMEKTFAGTEYIITKERTTPLRKEHIEPGQSARKDALLGRLQNNNPLYLFFCKDGKGTPVENEKYQREIFSKYGTSSERPVLFEYQFPFSKDSNEFPNELSGAIILGKQGNKPVAFCVRAAQANAIDGKKAIELSFGEVSENGSNTVSTWVNQWAAYLMEKTTIDIYNNAQAIQQTRQPLRASYI